MQSIRRRAMNLTRVLGSRPAGAVLVGDVEEDSLGADGVANHHASGRISVLTHTVGLIACEPLGRLRTVLIVPSATGALTMLAPPVRVHPRPPKLPGCHDGCN
jgi:hypothetical protein